jgi:hypothetical protein
MQKPGRPLPDEIRKGMNKAWLSYPENRKEPGITGQLDEA